MRGYSPPSSDEFCNCYCIRRDLVDEARCEKCHCATNRLHKIMEYLAPTPSQETKIFCCDCQTLITPNPVNKCVACVRKEVNISEGIPKQPVIYYCKTCERYLKPPNEWKKMDFNSPDLLELCLKTLKPSLSRVRIISASFVWTEEHSRRVRVKLGIQKEIMAGAVMEETLVVEFHIHRQMCDQCRRAEAKDFWRAAVQIRQKVEHKKTFYYLEQILLRYNAHKDAIVKPIHDGLDFYYDEKKFARNLVDFLLRTIPCRYKTAQQLISHDTHSNTYNYKWTFSVEIVPICKDNIVCLPEKLARSLGGISQICICTQVSEQIHLIDPSTTQIAEISSQIYWREPFGSIGTSKQLQEFIVMDVELINPANKRTFAGQGATSNKHVLADVWVVRASELGISDTQHHCRSHIGHLLSPGDTVLGFDLANANINDKNFEKLKTNLLPDVIIVKKHYADKALRNRRRKWKLKHLTEETLAMDDDNDREYIEFLEDLEENPNIRQQINIYADRNKMAVDTDETDEDDIPRITLQEMLEDMHIAEDATGGENTPMME